MANEHAAALGREGGKKGAATLYAVLSPEERVAKARAAAMTGTPEERSERARVAALAGAEKRRVKMEREARAKEILSLDWTINGFGKSLCRDDFEPTVDEAWRDVIRDTGVDPLGFSYLLGVTSSSMKMERRHVEFVGHLAFHLSGDKRDRIGTDERDAEASSAA